MLKHYHLQVSTNLNNLSDVLDWLNQISPVSLPEMDWLRCKIAVAEGFTNAVRHAHRDLPGETPIDLEVNIAPDSIELYVWDRGAPFDLLLQLSKMPQADQESDRGRGLLIMNQVADRLSYKRMDDVKNVLVMVKYVSEPS